MKQTTFKAAGENVTVFTTLVSPAQLLQFQIVITTCCLASSVITKMISWGINDRPKTNRVVHRKALRRYFFLSTPHLDFNS